MAMHSLWDDRMTNSMGIKATRIAFILVFLVIRENASIDSGFIKVPSDAVAIVNDSTYFSCTTSKRPIDNQSIIWNHFSLVDGGQNSYIYDEGIIRTKYKKRFAIDRDLSSGKFNLLLLRLELNDAGRFECIHKEDVNNKEKGVSAELTVLRTNLDCKSNKDLRKVVGPTQCKRALAPDEVQLSCSVEYNGRYSPQMVWRRFESSLKAAKTDCVTTDNRVACNTTLTADLQLNGSIYICELTTQQYNCSLEIKNIPYVFSGNARVNITINEEVTCSANSSQSCSYNWKWQIESLSPTVSTNQTLKSTTVGLHQCEATCEIGNTTCVVDVMVVEVTSNQSHEASNGKVWLIPLIVVLSVIIVASILVGLGLLYFRRKRRQRQAKSEEEIPLAEKQIWDLTVLNKELFILRRNHQDIEVYDSTEFHFKRRMEVDGMTDPRSIASCSVNNCLYVVDTNHQKLLHAILRIDPSNVDLIKAWKLTGALSDLSVASDTNVIICPYKGFELYEYIADGELVRVIDLGRNPVDMTPLINPEHAVKLDNGLFVVCQYIPGEIYLISTKETSSALGRIDEVEIFKKFSEELGDLIDNSWGPMYLSVDKEGSILVTDRYYDRVVLMNSNFGEARIIISEKDGIKSLHGTCFNESTGEWIVIDGNRICVCLVEGETIQRKIHDLISH